MFSDPLDLLKNELQDYNNFIEHLGENIASIINPLKVALEKGFENLEDKIKLIETIIRGIAKGIKNLTFGRVNPLEDLKISVDTDIAEPLKNFSDFLLNIPQNITNLVGDAITWINALIDNSLGFVGRINAILDSFKIICFVACGVFGFKIVACILVFIGMKTVGINIIIIACLDFKKWKKKTFPKLSSGDTDFFFFIYFRRFKFLPFKRYPVVSATYMYF